MTRSYRVAGHFHRVGVERVVVEETLEDIVQAVAQNVVQQDHRLTAARRFRRQIDEARHLIGRDLQQRIVDARAANDLHCQVGVIVFQKLHQVGVVVDQDRRDVLAQMLFEILPQPDLLVLGHLAFVDQEDLIARHFQQQIVVQAVELLIGFQHLGLDLFSRWREAPAEPCSSLIRMRRLRSAKRTL